MRERKGRRSEYPASGLANRYQHDPTAHAPMLIMENNALNMAGLFKVPAPVGEKHRVKRSNSPQPSTSAASTPCAPEEEPASIATRNSEAATSDADIPDSVYCHIDQSLLNEIGQLRGLKSGRRRGRWRRLHQAKLAVKYTDAIKYLEPMLLEELVKQQGHHVLITSALDHFANTVTGIADQLEGKNEPNEYTIKLEAFKKKAAELREKRRARSPNAVEFLDGPPPPIPKLSEEEILRRMREETEAAVEALSTGDPQDECLNDRFTYILEALKTIK